MIRPPITFDELFQRGNQYKMLEDNIVAVTKRMVGATSYSSHYGEGKGNRGWDDQDMRGKHGSMDSRCTEHHNEVEGLGH